MKGRQRYKCKKCGCNYTVELKLTAKPKSQKRQALHFVFWGDRDIHGGGIQHFVQTLFGKSETKIEVLFQKDGNVGNINSFVDAL